MQRPGYRHWIHHNSDHLPHADGAIARLKLPYHLSDGQQYGEIIHEMWDCVS